jgi:8-oxo-dGTP pyrophosphatase MutT (NUDIX family)
MNKLNYFQMQILRELIFKPNSTFTDLNIAGLTSDHFSYHIKKLLKLKLVQKVENKHYTLTTKGKEYGSSMNTEKLAIEKQPKVTTLIIVFNNIQGKEHVLVQIRKKEPYYDYKGFISGKTAFGETILETAARELMEEANLEADLELRYIQREHVYSKEGEILEDKIFHVIKGRYLKGELKNTKEGLNEWHPVDTFSKLDKLFYNEVEFLENCIKPPKEFYREMIYEVDEF